MPRRVIPKFHSPGIADLRHAAHEGRIFADDYVVSQPLRDPYEKISILRAQQSDFENQDSAALVKRDGIRARIRIPGPFQESASQTSCEDRLRISRKLPRGRQRIKICDPRTIRTLSRIFFARQTGPVGIVGGRPPVRRMWRQNRHKLSTQNRQIPGSRRITVSNCNSWCASPIAFVIAESTHDL